MELNRASFVRGAAFSCVAAVALAAGIAAAGAADKAAHDGKGGMKGMSMEMHQMVMRDSKDMMSTRMSGDMDMDFAMMMRHHHQSGIKMAEMELKHGKDAEMKRMAQKIMDSQKKEIEEFDAWMKGRKPAAK